MITFVCFKMSVDAISLETFTKSRAFNPLSEANFPTFGSAAGGASTPNRSIDDWSLCSEWGPPSSRRRPSSSSVVVRNNLRWNNREPSLALLPQGGFPSNFHSFDSDLHFFFPHLLSVSYLVESIPNQR